MKCRHLLKTDRAYKRYAKETTEKMKTDLKLYDRAGDGENRERNNVHKYNPHRGTEQSSPLVTYILNVTQLPN